MSKNIVAKRGGCKYVSFFAFQQRIVFYSPTFYKNNSFDSFNRIGFAGNTTNERIITRGLNGNGG